MLMPTCQPIVMLPTGWQTRATTRLTVTPHRLSHQRTWEAKSLPGVL